MRRLTIIASMVLGALAILAIPSSSFAISDCTYANDDANGGSQDVSTGPVPVTGTTGTVTVYADTTADGEGGGRTGGANAAGACADNVYPAVGPRGLDGGYAEAGAGEDPATGQADEGAIPGVEQPDGYAVVDGSNDNVDPTNQGDGYIGVSNWETGSSKASSGTCDTGAASSSNSGGCVRFRSTNTSVYVPGDVPTPVCGNTSGNDWTGTTLTEGLGDSDGCDPFEIQPF